MTDAQLLTLLKKDPDRGMECLIDRYAGLVYSIVRTRLCDLPTAANEIDACVQDTFSEFYTEIARYDPCRASIKTYLCVMARNNAADIFRKANKHLSMQASDEEMLTLSCDGGMEEGVILAQERVRILRAIKELGEPDSTILLCKYYLCQPSKEIARSLSMTAENVDTRAHRALKKLRVTLGGNE